jgi:uncharacterized protein DUF2784
VLYRIAADGVVILHALFTLFSAFGGLLVLRRPRLAWLHLPALAWGVWIELSHHVCPLTRLEKVLRADAGEAGYPGGFIRHYLIPLIYPPGLKPWHQIAIAVFLLAMNAAVYAVLIRRRFR